MTLPKLNNAPLVEAILEVRWRLVGTPNTPDMAVDPNYKLIVGRLYEKLRSTYPLHEPLPTASMPDEMMAYVVQHRFRIDENKWPVVQIGPGVITLNDTHSYEWNNFRDQGCQLLTHLFEIYSTNTRKPLDIIGLQLRYIDAIPFDFENENVSKFLDENLKINFSIPESLFQDVKVNSTPKGMNAIFEFESYEPKGIVRFRFGRGTHSGENAIIWETVVQSDDKSIPKLPENLSEWLNNAHDITHKLFFKLIEGPLHERFR